MGAPGVTRGWTSLNPYTVIVGSVPTGFSGARGQADAIAGRLAKVGLPAGVLLSSDYPSLASGYWVVYSGDFAQTTQAGVHQDNVRASGFTDAHVAEVSDTPTLRPTTLADLNGKTYLPVFFLVPGVVSHIEFRSDPSDPKGLQWYTFRAVSQGHLFWVTVAPSNFFEFSEENAPDPAHYTDITMRYPLLTGTLVRVFIYSAKAPPTAIQDFAQALAGELVIKG